MRRIRFGHAPSVEMTDDQARTSGPCVASGHSTEEPAVESVDDARGEVRRETGREQVGRPLEADLPANGEDRPENRGPGAGIDISLWPELEALIGPRGRLQSTLPDYERRPGQELMIRAVAHALERGHDLVVEAGTGIGKSLGYLLPAALSGMRVILSTGTRTLQDQLANKQVPFVRDVLGVDLVAAVLKGRMNYLCLLQLDSAKGNPEVRLDEHAELSRILAWAEKTETGDRGELRDVSDSSSVWRAVAADSERCVGRTCPRFADCFLMAARRKAEAADLIIVNHHLFFADLQLRDGAKFSLLPDADAVVFDEAHHLENIAAHAFGRSISDARLRRLGSDLRRSFGSFDVDSGRLEAHLAELDRDRERLWSHLVEARVRMRFEVERMPEGFLEAWYKLDNTLISLGLWTHKQLELLGERDERRDTLERIPQRIEELRSDMLALLGQRAEGAEVRWIEPGERATFVRSAPVDVGPHLRRTLEGRFRSLVFTSATLQAGPRNHPGFSHFKERIGLPESTPELALPSPFDYRAQAILYVPRDMPDPRSDGHAAFAHAKIAALVALTNGRALLLFTSRERMLDAHRKLAGTWSYPTLVQGEGSKEALLARFLEQKGAVLFATATFWEGVDIMGDALSLVVIDKLPFAAPGDPLTDARLQTIASRGGNAFRDYQVPTAILALRQGFGRLIRHRGDRGIVAILDSRLLSAGYGRRFLSSLPDANFVSDFKSLEESWKKSDMEADQKSLEPVPPM
jgi:ATP-dependent DNA helicase DinG